MAREARHSCDRDDLVVLPDDHVIGRASAAITVIAYCDFECPYCRMAQPVIHRLRVRFADSLRVVFRHFPLIKKHPNARLAAEASVAAALQDRFWPMHDVLYQNQQHLEIDDLYLYAGMAGLDVPNFKDDLHAGSGVLKVRRDVLSGHRCGVTGTPTFFVNHVRVSDSEELEPTVLNQSKE
jgi:protein-disulfide isomerase